MIDPATGIDTIVVEGLTATEYQQIRDQAYNVEHPASWVWVESELSWKTPVDPPNDNEPYQWDETTISWIPFQP